MWSSYLSKMIFGLSFLWRGLCTCYSVEVPMTSKQILFFLFVVITSFKSWARIDLQKTKILMLPSDVSAPLISEESKNKIIPSAINSNESGGQVLAQMADNTASLWWSTTPLKNSSIGRAADAAEKKLNVQAAFEDENKIKHTFNFKVLAMQALARVEYKGWVHAAISYDARAAKTEAEISEKINSTEDFVISHSATTAENKSQVGFRWNW